MQRYVHLGPPMAQMSQLGHQMGQQQLHQMFGNNFYENGNYGIMNMNGFGQYG